MMQLKSFLRRYKVLLISGLLLSGVMALLAIVHAQLHIIKLNQTRVLSAISKSVQHSVSADHVALDWDGFSPVIKLTGVRVYADATANPKHCLRIGAVTIDISWWRSLLSWQWLPSKVLINNANLSIKRLPLGAVRIKGYGTIASHPNKQKKQDLYQYFAKMPAFSIAVNHVNLNWNDGHHLFRLMNMQLVYETSNLGRPKLLIGAEFSGAHHMQLTVAMGLRRLFSVNYAAEIDLTAKRLDLAKLQQFLNLSRFFPHTNIVSGFGNCEISMLWYGEELHIVKYTGDIRHIRAQVWRSPSLASQALIAVPVGIQRLAGRGVWNKESVGWRLRLHDLNIHIKNRALPLHTLTYSVEKSAGRSTALKKLFVDKFDLYDLNEILKAHSFAGLKKGNASWLRHFRGKLSKISVVLTAKNKLLNCSGQFHALSFPVHDRVPGVYHVSGNFHFQPKVGWLNINSENAQLQWPSHEKPIWFHNFSGQLNYNKKVNGYAYSIDNIELDNDEFHFSGGIESKGQDVLSSKANGKFYFTMSNLTHIHHYFPYSFMHKGLKNWLASAFQRGRLSHGEIKVQGRLDQFPFVNRPGLFVVRARMQRARLHFAPHWPSLRHLQARLQFKGAAMYMHIEHALIDHNVVTDSVATIPNMAHHAVLSVDTHARSDLKYGHRLINDSPMSLAHRIRHLIIRGPYQMHLLLTVPLDKTKLVKADGHLTMQKDAISLPEWKINAQNLRGVLHFTEKNLSAHNIVGQFLGSRIRLDLHTDKGVQPSNKRYFDFTISGKVAADSLLKQYKLDLQPFIQGALAYRVNLNLPGQANQPSFLIVSSNLKGLSLQNVPTVLAKSSQLQRPLSVTLIMPAAKPAQVDFDYASRVLGHLVLPSKVAKQKRWRVSLHFGGGEVDKQCKGVCLSGQLPQVDYSRWYHFVSALGKSFRGLTSSSSAIPTLDAKASLLIGRFNLLTQTLTRLKVNLTQLHTGWESLFSSDQGQGLVFIPKDSKQPWEVVLQNLKLKALTSKPHPRINPQRWLKLSQPQLLPPLNIDIRHAKIGSSYYNQLKLVTLHETAGLQIHDLLIHTPTLRADFHGGWLAGAQAGTHLQGHLTINNVGVYLSQANITHVLQSGIAKANINIVAPSTPFSLQTNHMNAEINFRIENGRIKMPSSAKGSVALLRVLNLLSVTGLPQHIATVFTDIGKKGLQFTSLAGVIHLQQGVAQLQRVDMDGPNAHISLKGQVDMPSNTCDIQIQVAPYVTSSLPLIAGVAAGPVAGVATWVVNKMLEPSIGKAVGFRYHVYGNLNNPSVVKLGNSAAMVSKNEGVAQ